MPTHQHAHASCTPLVKDLWFLLHTFPSKKMLKLISVLPHGLLHCATVWPILVLWKNSSQYAQVFSRNISSICNRAQRKRNVGGKKHFLYLFYVNTFNSGKFMCRVNRELRIKREAFVYRIGNSGLEVIPAVFGVVRSYALFTLAETARLEMNFPECVYLIVNHLTHTSTRGVKRI